MWVILAPPSAVTLVIVNVFGVSIIADNWKLPLANVPSPFQPLK
jgi:hypothetical protein